MAYCQGYGAVRASYLGATTMSDKSPRKSMSKKSGKSLKEKRADKKAKHDRATTTEIIPSTKKH